MFYIYCTYAIYIIVIVIFNFQINKLVAAGADILAPVAVGPKRQLGTAVDYAYHLYNLDKRIAHMPYHALTYAERETFNSRKAMQAHLADLLRGKATEIQKEQNEKKKNEEGLWEMGKSGESGETLGKVIDKGVHDIVT